MTNERWLISVAAGRWQTHGIKTARSLGFKVIGIDSDSDASGFKYCDLTLVCGFDQVEKMIEQLHELRPFLAGAVSFCSEAGQFVAARLREEFNLPGPDCELVRKLTDKTLQRQEWQRCGVSGPEWVACQTPHDARKASEKIGFPIVIKPADSAGSRGVAKIEDSSQLVEAIPRAFTFSSNGLVIVEKFMDGTEYAVELFATDGVVIPLLVSQKEKIPTTNGVVASELATARCESSSISKIEELAISAVKALGYTDGPGHAEVILSNDGSCGMVELAGRGGGFLVSDELVPAASGFNLAEYTVRSAVGDPIELPLFQRREALLRFFPTTKGIVSKIEGFLEANKIDDVSAGAFCSIGDTVQDACCDGDRLGYILVVGDSVESVAESAGRAEAMISILVDPIE